MKLSQDMIDYIEEVVRICRLVNVDSVAIEPSIIRGMDEKKTVVVLQNKNVPNLKFGSIGLSRLNTFQTRIDIAKQQENFVVESTVREGTDYIQSLLMKAKGTKVDFRCMDPSKIDAPKQVKDPMKYEIQINELAVTLIQKAVAAMDAEDITLLSNSEGVSFEVIDIGGDVFKHTFAKQSKSLDDSKQTSFAFRYPIKTLLSIFKENPQSNIQIGERGVLLFPITGIGVYVLPKVT